MCVGGNNNRRTRPITLPRLEPGSPPYAKITRKLNFFAQGGEPGSRLHCIPAAHARAGQKMELLMRMSAHHHLSLITIGDSAPQYETVPVSDEATWEITSINTTLNNNLHYQNIRLNHQNLHDTDHNPGTLTTLSRLVQALTSYLKCDFVYSKSIA